MNELIQAIENLMQPYIHWVEDVLRVKCCYEKLLSEFLHIKHGFLTEADLAKQFAAYFKTESQAAMPHRKLNGPAPLTSCHEVFTPEGGTPFLCASYDFDRLGAFLYEDFFRGLAEHLDQEADFLVVGQTEDGPALLRMAKELEPDAVVLDLELTGMDGLEVVEDSSGISSLQEVRGRDAAARSIKERTQINMRPKRGLCKTRVIFRMSP